MGLSGLGKLTRSFDGDDSVDLVAIDGRSGQHKANPGKNATPIRTTSRKESVSLDGSKTYSMESAEKMWAKAFRQSVHGISLAPNLEKYTKVRQANAANLTEMLMAHVSREMNTH